MIITQDRASRAHTVLRRTQDSVIRLREAGLNLMELMVAMTIGLFITLGLLVMMGGASRSFVVQDDFARMQEGGVAALRYIGDSIRHAGFMGVAAESGSITLSGVTTASDCGTAQNLPEKDWALRTDRPVHGYKALTQANVTDRFACIQKQNFQDGPVLVARGGNGYRVPSKDGNYADDIVLQPNYLTTIYVQSDANGGILFQGKDYATLRAARKHKTLSSGDDAPVFEYQSHVYYVRPCSRPTGAGSTCQASDDGGRPIPTLVRQELSGDSMVERALVEGVERMIVLYGIDATTPNGSGGTIGQPDGIPERFVTEPVDDAEWGRVVSVRVAIIIRSPTPITGFEDDKSYDLDANGVVDFTCTAGVNCNYMRKVFSQTIQLRNVAQRRGS